MRSEASASSPQEERIPRRGIATAPRPLPPFPSSAALALERASWDELECKFVDGGTPELADLVGWEFRGINTQLFRSRHTPRLAGIKKFCKGMFRHEDGRVLGYNSPVAQNALDGRWDVAPRRFGFYQVAPVDSTARDNAYLHAVLLDYSRGGGKPLDPTRGLRDYLVQIDRDIYLGKAYYALGPLRVHSNFFILERHRVGLTDYARR
ncbi:MAG TPA: hypothetical protein VMJ10_26485 [Kofleriaceae bacterium]|nr:hypothetical protein [Kofleriaceae bacterium]